MRPDIWDQRVVGVARDDLSVYSGVGSWCERSETTEGHLRIGPVCRHRAFPETGQIDPSSTSEGGDAMRFVIPLLLAAVAAPFAGCGRDQPGTPKASPPKEEADVVFRAADGRTLAMADLRGLSGTFPYEILGKSNVPAEAESLHQQARQAGEAGDYKKAIALLGRASSLAPAWPYPVYDMAFTYLLMKDAENARKYYRKTVELAPRFLHRDHGTGRPGPRGEGRPACGNLSGVPFAGVDE